MVVYFGIAPQPTYFRLVKYNRLFCGFPFAFLLKTPLKKAVPACPRTLHSFGTERIQPAKFGKRGIRDKFEDSSADDSRSPLRALGNLTCNKSICFGAGRSCGVKSEEREREREREKKKRRTHKNNEMEQQTKEDKVKEMKCAAVVAAW